MIASGDTLELWHRRACKGAYYVQFAVIPYENTFDLAVNTFKSQQGDIELEGSGGVTEQWVEDYVSAQTSAFVTNTELGTVLEAYPTTSSMNTAISTATSDKVTGSSVGQAPAILSATSVYASDWATLSSTADENTMYVVLPDPVLLTRVKYTTDSGLPDWEGDIVGSIIGGDGSPTSQIPNVRQAKEIVIGSNVTSIEDSSFYWLSGLTSVTIGDNVTSIGNDVFFACHSLTSMTIGDNVASIGSNAFYLCDGLTSMTIPDSVTSIGESAFEDSTVNEVTFSGKTKATVQGMNNYSWVLPSGCVIHCTDGDITIA